jgi:hypothetical protein
MEKKATAAIDIIYTLPDALQSILRKLEALEARNAMLEQKLNMLLRQPPASEVPALPAVPAQSPPPEQPAPEEPSEVMEIRSKAPKRPSEPFNFSKTSEASAAAVAASIPALDLQPPPPPPPDGVRIPIRNVDPMPENAIPSESAPEKQTATLIRGRLKEREGASIAAVDVKIFDEKNIMIKKTKTAATGEWIAMLLPGEYTAEFTKPGQKPLFKPISIVSGKKELEILI